MVSALVNRYLWLINTLMRYTNGATLEQINNEWTRSTLAESLGNTNKISRKTFNNHRNQIFLNFGIEIKCVKAGKYSFYCLDKSALSPKENNQFNFMLKYFAIQSMQLNSESISNKILLESTEGCNEFLAPITEALKRNQRLSIDYQGYQASSNLEEGIVIEPLCLKMFKRRWYLLANKVAVNEKRLYCLDRIRDCKFTNDTFAYPKDFNAEEYFEKYFGVSLNGFEGHNTEPCLVTLRAYGSLPKYLKSQPLHPTQREEEGNGYTDFRYVLIPAYDFVEELLMHSQDLEVRSPDWLRDKVANILTNAVDRYKNPQRV